MAILFHHRGMWRFAYRCALQQAQQSHSWTLTHTYQRQRARYLYLYTNKLRALTSGGDLDVASAAELVALDEMLPLGTVLLFRQLAGHAWQQQAGGNHAPEAAQRCVSLCWRCFCSCLGFVGAAPCVCC